MKHDTINLEKELLKNVLNGQWGTIGPKSLNASEVISKKLGLSYGVTTFSTSSALETVLRAFNIGFGDEVIIASYSEPIESMVTAAVGATPIFADICADLMTLSVKSVASRLTANTRAIIANMPLGNPCDAKALSDFSKEKGVKFILNFGDGYCTKVNGVSAAKYADVSIINLESGTALDIGQGGAIVTDCERTFNACFAYHNCGRPFGDGCSLSFDQIIGGNMRIAEWQSSLVESRMKYVDFNIDSRKIRAKKLIDSLPVYLKKVEILKGGESSYSGVMLKYDKAKNNDISIDCVITDLCKNGYNSTHGYKAMHAQKVFCSNYFKKLTGHIEDYFDYGLENSLIAEKNILFIKL